jgi:NAD(P)-dependent dehydrogenase (short-subunit alcohol dehydrogenase family)
MELLDHTAVITGGRAGIGLESARLLASEGATVIISARNRARGEQAVEAIGANARFVQADMADADAAASSTSPPWPRSKESRVRRATALQRPHWNR